MSTIDPVRNCLSFANPFSTTGISTFVAAIPHVMRQFHLTRTVALLPTTLYTVGIIVGPLVCSPLSELYGRRWIYWTNFPMLVVFQAIAAASDNFAVLVIFRFLAGAGGSGVLAVGAGMIPAVPLHVDIYLSFIRLHFRHVGPERRRSRRSGIYPGSFPWSNPRPSYRRIHRCTVRQRLEVRRLGQPDDSSSRRSCHRRDARNVKESDSTQTFGRSPHQCRKQWRYLTEDWKSYAEAITHVSV